MKIVNLTSVFIYTNMQHLFVYGSLLFPELVTALTGKSFGYMPAILNGFKRYRIKGCDYPAIVEESGAKVEGYLIENVDEKSLQILTFFEGEEYKKRQVVVSGSKERINTIIFVWVGKKELLEERDWDKFEFKQKSLKDYLEKVVPETKAAFRAINL